MYILMGLAILSLLTLLMNKDPKQGKIICQLEVLKVFRFSYSKEEKGSDEKKELEENQED